MQGSNVPVPWLHYRVLAARLGLGERGKEIDQTKKSLQSIRMNGILRFDPDFDGVRHEPWFQALLAEADAKK